jgi:ABC-type amino acid transport substrate-binding protein
MRLRLTALAGLVSIVCAAVGVVPAARAQEAKLRLVEPGALTVATYGTGIPAIVVGPGDHLGGLDGAFFTAFARDHHLKLKLYQTTFASMILAVEQGKVDVGVYIFYTPERAKHVYYTYPFWVSHARLFTLKSFKYSGPASLNGQKVGTVIGFVWAPYLQKWSASGAALYPDQATVAQALLNGQIQGYVNGEVVMHTPPLSSSHDVVANALNPGDFDIPEKLLANVSYNIVDCNNAALAAALNAEMTKLHSTGEWAKVLTENGLGPDSDVKLAAPEQGCGAH